MNTRSGGGNFPFVLLVLAAMFFIFAGTARTTWLLLISGTGFLFVMAAAAIHLVRSGREHD